MPFGVATVVTNKGKDITAARLIGATPSQAEPKYVGMGTGATAATRTAAAADTAAIVTVEDHWPEGGLGEAVLSVLANDETRSRVLMLAVRDMPASATPAEQRAAAGIDAASIVRAARDAVSQMHHAATT